MRNVHTKLQKQLIRTVAVSIIIITKVRSLIDLQRRDIEKLQVL